MERKDILNGWKSYLERLLIGEKQEETEQEWGKIWKWKRMKK
jgi:hypothetical protein